VGGHVYWPVLVKPSKLPAVSSLTLHAGGAEALAGEEDGVVVVLRVLGVRLLLHKGPAAHVLQAPGRVPALDEADGLDRGGGGGGGGRGGRERERERGREDS